MLLSAVSVLVVAQSSSEIPEGLMNNPVYITKCNVGLSFIFRYSQVFNVVFSCQAADIQPVSDFVPGPMNHVHINGRNCRARNSS